MISVLLLLSAALAIDRDTCAKAPSDYRKDLLALINSYRTERGLKPLSLDKKLNSLADSHSDSMCRRGVADHDNFIERFKKSGRRNCVENVGWNYRTPKEQLNAWKESGAHNKNLLSKDIARAGISKAGDYITFFACD